MATITLPYPTLGPGVVDDSEIDSNFSTITSAVNGNLDNANIKASAGIATSKLAADNYEIVLTCALHGTELNTGTSGFFVVGGIPYDSANTTYTISAIETFTIAGGARTAAVFDLRYGTAAQYIAGTSTAIKTSISTGTGAAVYRGEALASFTTSVATSSTAPSFFILDVTTAGVSWVANDSFALCIKLKKALRT